jgi:hypothetical protein
VVHLAQRLHLRQLQALLPGPILLFQSFYGHYFAGLLVLRFFDVAEGPRA